MNEPNRDYSEYEKIKAIDQSKLSWLVSQRGMFGKSCTLGRLTHRFDTLGYENDFSDFYDPVDPPVLLAVYMTRQCATCGEVQVAELDRDKWPYKLESTEAKP